MYILSCTENFNYKHSLTCLTSTHMYLIYDNVFSSLSRERCASYIQFHMSSFLNIHHLFFLLYNVRDYWLQLPHMVLNILFPLSQYCQTAFLYILEMISFALYFLIWFLFMLNCSFFLSYNLSMPFFACSLRVLIFTYSI